MPAVESVTAIRVDDTPCCIEILLSGLDRSMPDPDVVPGLGPAAADSALLVLELQQAEVLRAKLDAAIGALQEAIGNGG
jgi:hypothetical protein